MSVIRLFILTALLITMPLIAPAVAESNVGADLSEESEFVLEHDVQGSEGHFFAGPGAPCWVRGTCRVPSRADCVNAAMDLLPRHDYDSESEYEEINQMCKGNYDGGCLRAAAEYIPRHELNEKKEIFEVINVCRRVIGGDCLKARTRTLPPHKYNERKEVVEIIRSCGND